MEVRGVLVTCQTTGNKDGGVCSGILFADNWILTIGTILDSVFRDGNQKYKLFEEHAKSHLRPHQLLILPTSIRKCLPKFGILMDASDSDLPSEAPSLTETVPVPFSVFDENQSNVTASPTSQAGLESPFSSQRARRSAGIAAMWRCPLVAESTNVMLGGWQLSPSKPKAQHEAAFKTLLSTFLLLKVEDDRISTSFNKKDVMAALEQLELRLKRPKRGEDVVIESTIFGREFFFNSWSQGIVSNVFGNGGSLLLTDARSGIGCEGGPIFTLAERTCDRRLVGMVLSPVCWWKGEWVGFTIGVALHPMIVQLQTGSPRSDLTTRILGSSWCEVEKTLADSSVVLVRCGSAWGSGVVVDSRLGLILTCSHVVKTQDQGGVGVWWAGSSLPATLVYRTKSDVAYDLALLRVTPSPRMQQVAMSHEAAVKGESVFVVGFPMFSEREGRPVSPIVTRGIVAHVTAPMVQTTCCVQSGASGGPVLRPSGEMVGIVSCNANDVDTGALFPHVNMAVPATAFATHIQRYIDTLDVEALRPLEEPDEAVQQMWKLNVPSSKL